MREGRRSRTAEATAQMRALHRVVDEEPTVFDDPYAAPLLGLRDAPGSATTVDPADLTRRFRQRMQPRVRRAAVGTRRLRAQLVTRSRYAEDKLAKTIDRGVDQYVVLAAGLDSFALRRRDLSAHLQVFEVDHPETQSWKLERMTALSEPPLENLVLIPYDFERQLLSEALADSPFDTRRPAFISWLGVTYYLSHAAILDTFSVITELAEGSELVFDYWSLFPRRVADGVLLSAIRLGVRSQGEPMHSFFRAAALEELVASSGLELIENLDADAIQRRYLMARRDGLVVPGFARLAHVGVR